MQHEADLASIRKYLEERGFVVRRGLWAVPPYAIAALLGKRCIRAGNADTGASLIAIT